MKLENDRYEELMIDLALLKKQGQRQQHDFNAMTIEGTSDKGVNTSIKEQNMMLKSIHFLLVKVCKRSTF